MSKTSDRLPSKKQLEAMGSSFALATLDAMAKESREVIEREDISFVRQGHSLPTKQGRARACARLNRIYALAHELGHYVGQPNYPAEALSTISFAASQKAEWRREKADRYPDDLRNALAVETLAALAESQPTDYDLARRFCNRYTADRPSRDAALQTLSDYMTDVGFRSNPKSIDDFMRLALGLPAKAATPEKSTLGRAA